MCAATAAAVGTAVAAVAAVGTQVASSLSGPSGPSAGAAPKQQKVPGFAPATGLQSYSARLLAENRATRTPSALEWAASGGTLRPDWQIPDFTPREAEQLKLVEKGTGKPMPTFNPDTETQLSPAAMAQLGREKLREGKQGGWQLDKDIQVNPQIQAAQLSNREEMINQAIASKGSTPQREKRLANVRSNLAKINK